MYKTGFTFDEKILQNYNIKEFFDLLQENPFDSIELAPDTSILSFSKYKEISKCIEKQNGELNFHVPYFVNQSFFDFSSDKETLIKHYTKLFNIIKSLRQYSIKTPTLVIHGGSKIDKNSFSKTLSMMDYLLNDIEKNNMDLNLSFETLSKESNLIGSNRDEVISVINEFNTNKLKICWDLCHDFYNYDKYIMPDKDFLENINYVHVHGKNIDKHLSTKKYFDFEYFIKHYNFNQTINIELLKSTAKDTYLEDLIEDIKHLNAFKKANKSFY